MQKRKKVLIADDDAGILDSIGMILEFEGYEVHTTTNGNSLLNMEAQFPDILLLDIWMSGIDGRDICRKLKQNKSTRNIPILMISASKDIEKSAIESGANDFLAKPFELNDLLKKIEKNMHR